MNKSKRKIQLSRESVRVLTTGELGAANGAGTYFSVFCPSDARCSGPSQGACSNPCPQSGGLRCY